MIFQTPVFNSDNKIIGEASVDLSKEDIQLLITNVVSVFHSIPTYSKGKKRYELDELRWVVDRLNLLD